MARGERLGARGAEMSAVYVVVEGSIAACVDTERGERFAYQIGGPGWVYGLVPLIDGRPAPHSVMALEPATVLEVPLAEIRAMLAERPELWGSVALELASRFRDKAATLADHALQPLRVRLARSLLKLAAMHGRPAGVSVEIHLKLSNELIGETLGVARQTAALHLQDMVSEGLIRWHYGRAILCDVGRLHVIEAEHQAEAVGSLAGVGRRPCLTPFPAGCAAGSLRRQANTP